MYSPISGVFGDGDGDDDGDDDSDDAGDDDGDGDGDGDGDDNDNVDDESGGCVIDVAEDATSSVSKYSVSNPRSDWATSKLFDVIILFFYFTTKYLNSISRPLPCIPEVFSLPAGQKA